MDSGISTHMLTAEIATKLWRALMEDVPDRDPDHDSRMADLDAEIATQLGRAELFGIDLGELGDTMPEEVARSAATVLARQAEELGAGVAGWRTGSRIGPEPAAAVFLRRRLHLWAAETACLQTLGRDKGAGYDLARAVAMLQEKLAGVDDELQTRPEFIQESGGLAKTWKHHLVGAHRRQLPHWVL